MANSILTAKHPRPERSSRYRSFHCLRVVLEQQVKLPGLPRSLAVGRRLEDLRSFSVKYCGVVVFLINSSIA